MIFHFELVLAPRLLDMINHVKLRPPPRAQTPLRPPRWVSSVTTRLHAHAHIFFSAAICSSCRTTPQQQQLSISRMEKQDEKRQKRKGKEQENPWLQDKLLTSTYNTGPDSFVKVARTYMGTPYTR